MREHFSKLFYDKPKLYVLIGLRMNGYALTSLAQIFKCDVSSIRHQCDKYGIFPEVEVYSIESILKGVLNQTQPALVVYEEEYGQKWSLGKSYKEYLKEAKYPHIKIR